MKLKTRVFGEIDIDDEKIITFENGIIGFPDLKRFTLIFNEEKKGGISWMQSLDEPVVALPVMNPLAIKEDYNPMVEDELLKPLGEMTPENTFVSMAVWSRPNQRTFSRPCPNWDTAGSSAFRISVVSSNTLSAMAS